MRELRILLLRPPVKAAILGLFTILFGILCNFAVGSGKTWRWICLIAVGVVELVVLVAYAKAEESLEQKLYGVTETLQRKNGEFEDLQFTNEAFSKAMQGIATVCKFCAKNANIQIHEIIDNKRIDCKAWNFDLASDIVCESIYTNVIEPLGIAKASDGIVDIEIGYVKLVEDNSSTSVENKISLCGYYHPTRNGPKILGKQRVIEEGGYHDAALFYEASDQPDIQIDSAAVLAVFQKSTGKDYSQYLGIPIFCATQNKTSKMIGLLQVVCHGNSILSDNIEQIQTLTNTFFAPYANLFLLLFKMDKALRAQPRK